MPDEPQTLPPLADSPSTTPTLPDPQKLVDEALTGPMTPPSTTVTTSTETVTPTESSVPLELISPPAPAETPLVAEVTPPLPVADATPVSTPMSDDMPLAFQSSIPTPSVSPDLATTTTTTTTAMPSSVLPSSPLDTPPVFTPPPADMAPPMPKKKKGGKVLAAILGLFLMLAGIGGGYYYYMSERTSPAMVAPVDRSEANCSGCDGGHQLVWRDGQCVWKARLCEDTPTPGAPVDAKVACSGPAGTWHQCGKTPSGCGGFCVNGVSKTCDQWLQQECGFEPERGAEFKVVGPNEACPAGYQSATCACGLTNGSKMCFNRGLQTQCGTPSDQNGLCAVWTQAGAPTTPGSQNPGSAKTYFCPNVFTIDGSNNACMTAAPGNFNPSCYCGTIQVDTPGVGFRTESMRCGCGGNPPPTPPPSPKPSPSVVKPILACTGLTKDKADANIKVGTVVQFTCAGASTPAGAVNLTYNFRLRKDSGTWQSLTATANKASYTVATTGNYDVQCRTCGTIAAANVCDPIWTGATQ